VAGSRRRLARLGLRLPLAGEIAGAATRIDRHRRPPLSRPGGRRRRRKRFSHKRISGRRIFGRQFFGRRIFAQRIFLGFIHIHGRWG